MWHQEQTAKQPRTRIICESSVEDKMQLLYGAGRPLDRKKQKC